MEVWSGLIKTKPPLPPSYQVTASRPYGKAVKYPRLLSETSTISFMGMLFKNARKRHETPPLDRSSCTAKATHLQLSLSWRVWVWCRLLLYQRKQRKISCASTQRKAKSGLKDSFRTDFCHLPSTRYGTLWKSWNWRPSRTEWRKLNSCKGQSLSSIIHNRKKTNSICMLLWD